MIERIAWGLLALVHLPPALALLAPGLITSLYGIDADNPAFLLLRHRAALFLVVLLVCLWAAADPATRRLAAVAATLSMGSFLLLWLGSGAPQALRSIALADAIGLVPLAYVSWRAFTAG